MSDFFSAFGFGIVAAGVLAVAAVGLTLQFGVTNYINFAYGELITFGAYATYALNQQTLHLNLWIAWIVGGLATGLLAFLVQRFVFTPFVNRRPQLLFALIVTFVVSLMLNDLYGAVFGTDFHEMPGPLPADSIHSIGPLLVEGNQIVYFAAAVLAMLAIQLMLNFTPIGRSMRAMSDDMALAKACGLNTTLITDVAWLVSGFLAGLAGVIIAMQTHTFGVDLGDTYLFLVFASVILGGIGRAYGAVAGAIVIGLGTQLSVLVVPSSVSLVAVFVVLVFIMVFRPEGFLGSVAHSKMER